MTSGECSGFVTARVAMTQGNVSEAGCGRSAGVRDYSAATPARQAN